MEKNSFSNYHTHTQRCKHARGIPNDYFEIAKSGGCREIGFSDHCPYPKNAYNLWQDVRMGIDEVSDYINDVVNLRKKSDFPIYVGFECEWDKDYKNWYSDKLIDELGAQYLVFGPHWLAKGKERIPATAIDNSSDLHAYIEQTIEGMRSGLYAFVAHPDLFMAHRVTWGEDEIACFDAIIDAAEDLQIPLEVNGLGMRRSLKETKFGIRYQYPHDEFWERVVNRNIKVVCNADAHEPEFVVSDALNARSYAEKFGLRVIESIF